MDVAAIAFDVNGTLVEIRTDLARTAMQEFLGTVHTQMRLVTGFEIVNHTLSMGLIAASAGATLWLWIHGQVGIGAVAAATVPPPSGISVLRIRLRCSSNAVPASLSRA